MTASSNDIDRPSAHAVEYVSLCQDRFGINFHIEIENSKRSGDTVSAIAKVDLDSLPPDLILVGAVEVTVKNGKITAFTFTLNDETVAKLAALEAK